MYCAIPFIYNSLQVDIVVDPRSSSGDLVYEDGIVLCGGTTGLLCFTAVISDFR